MDQSSNQPTNTVLVKALARLGVADPEATLNRLAQANLANIAALRARMEAAPAPAEDMLVMRLDDGAWPGHQAARDDRA